MLERLSLTVAASILLFAPSVVMADPITYDIAGTLTWPVYGTNQFTGSFTIDSNPVNVGISAGQAIETGSDLSIMLNVGGHTINFANSAADPNLVEASVNQIWSRTVVGQSSDYFAIGAGGQTNPGPDPNLTGIALTFLNPTDTIFSGVSTGQLLNLQNFPFSASIGGVQDNFDSAGTWALGTLTSVEPAAVPEPGTLTVFAVLGIAAITSKQYRRS